MKLQIVRTADGSPTLYQPDVNQHYHSTFGAVGESAHIFIRCGLRHVLSGITDHSGNPELPVRILEIGFGTGLNALLTLAESLQTGHPVFYQVLEPRPVPASLWKRLGYPEVSGNAHLTEQYSLMHESEWGMPVEIDPVFTLHKIRCRLEEFKPEPAFFQLVFFDAFDPIAQPELWTGEIFTKVASAMVPGGTLVTYSVKGTVVRALRAAGFCTEKLAGPPGKRHILRAIRQ